GRNLRDRPRITYTEEEVPKDDHYLYCEDWKSFFMEECELHGPAFFVPDIPAPLGAPDRARLTLLSGLEVRTSGIPEAGLGVFYQGNTVPAGAHYGPYEGEMTDKDQAMESVYSWVIYKSRHWDDYIDNQVSFQYRGGILYRCCKPIAVGLVRRGDARDLGIVFNYPWDRKSSATGTLPSLHPSLSSSGTTRALPLPCPPLFIPPSLPLEQQEHCPYLILLSSSLSLLLWNNKSTPLTLSSSLHPSLFL
uniref:SET domain-containing protein n=1 Tax=Oncorhynchus tshawytscha TaxID=74940 RepID=A0AAZ3NSS9_ONCTS